MGRAQQSDLAHLVPAGAERPEPPRHPHPGVIYVDDEECHVMHDDHRYDEGNDLYGEPDRQRAAHFGARRINELPQEPDTEPQKPGSTHAEKPQAYRRQPAIARGRFDSHAKRIASHLRTPPSSRISRSKESGGPALPARPETESVCDDMHRNGRCEATRA